MSLQTITPLCNTADKSCKRSSARSSSSPISLNPTSAAAREKQKGQREQLRQVFPFYQIKISRRTHSHREARPPIPKTGNAGLSHDFKNLKYQQIDQDFLPKQAWSKKTKLESSKENLSQDGAPFLQSLQDIKQEEKQLHNAVVTQLNTLRNLESVLEDNFRLVHVVEEKPPMPPAETHTDCEAVSKSFLRKCTNCGILVLPCSEAPMDFLCGCCENCQSHPLAKTEGVLAVEVQMAEKTAPKPPPKPPGAKSLVTMGALTERAGTVIRRRNFLASGREACKGVRIANKVVAFESGEKEYVYLPTSLLAAEFQPFEVKGRCPSNPITPSFNCQKHFLFSASKEECHSDVNRHAVTETFEGIAEVSETDLSRIPTELSLIEYKSELEISFSDPTNTSLSELLDAVPKFAPGAVPAHSAIMIAKDLDDVLQQQLATLASSTALTADVRRLLEVYGRHTRAMIRGLVKPARPHACALEKCFKGYLHIFDRLLQENSRLEQQFLAETERKRSDQDAHCSYQLQITQLQQTLARTVQTSQQKIDSLSAQIATYEAKIALYNKELAGKESPTQQFSVSRSSPDILSPYT